MREYSGLLMATSADGIAAVCAALPLFPLAWPLSSLVNMQQMLSLVPLALRKSLAEHSLRKADPLLLLAPLSFVIIVQRVHRFHNMAFFLDFKSHDPQYSA